MLLILATSLNTNLGKQSGTDSLVLVVDQVRELGPIPSAHKKAPGDKGAGGFSFYSTQ